MRCVSGPVLKAGHRGARLEVVGPCLNIISDAKMETSETIQCPYCCQSFDLVIDTSIPKQRFTTDCEVCCRPFEVLVECEPGEVISLEVQGT